jgi:tRNA (cmo5U34)-methyltransferase
MYATDRSYRCLVCGHRWPTCYDATCPACGMVAGAPVETARLDHNAPDGAWTFDGPVTDVFDEMLARSIPQYPVMRDAVFEVGSRFVQRGTTIVDLGASRGESLAPFVARFGSANSYHAVEVSVPMLDALQTRFATQIEDRLVRVDALDLRVAYPESMASLTLAVLALQFVPIEHRHFIARRIYEHTTPGGAVILVEKVLGSTALLHQTFRDRYHVLKTTHGYSVEEVERKRLSLEGVLVPLTASWNEDLLTRAGFSTVECFWRWMNFAAWIAVRG